MTKSKQSQTAPSEPVPLSSAGLEPVKGSWYQLLTDYGSGVGMIPKAHPYVADDGTEHREAQRQVLVLEVLEPGTAGAGAVDQPSPVVLWLERTPQGPLAPHHLQVHAAQFVQLFAEGQEPPEYADYLAQQANPPTSAEG